LEIVDEVTKPRIVRAVLRGPARHWVGDGFYVSNMFPAGNAIGNALSPFFLMDYHPPHTYPPTDQQRGVGAHPHRGFETVTIAWEGAIAHHDSEGNAGIVGPGDVQWMTAAAGILHKEYHEQSYARRGGPMHMAQLWVNLPRAHKMSKPAYQPIRARDMGVVSLEGGQGTVRVIAGEFRGARGPARTFTKINLWDVTLAAGARLETAFPARENAGILVVEGSVRACEHAAAAGDLVLYANEGEAIAIEPTAAAHLLVMSGEPIDEPAVQYGPFLMNTEEELRQAIADFAAGKFGHLA
jgi:redox-sensitive bicupin YhaK (pirin superfamily)